MSYSEFSRNAILLFCVLGLLTFALSYYPPFQQFVSVSWSSLIFMLIVIHLSYVFVKKGMEQKEHKDFMKGVSSGFAIKLLLSIIFLVSYKLIARPESKLFVLPFFAAYFSFTFLLTAALKKNK